MAHDLLRVRQLYALPGESILIESTNFVGFVKRTLVEAGSHITLPSGEEIILTPDAMAAYVTILNERNISVTQLDSSTGMTLSAQMDTRIVTFDPKWSSCRLSSSSSSTTVTSSLSQLTTIELTLPNGDSIDLASLGATIQFILPISCNQTLERIEAAKKKRENDAICNTTADGKFNSYPNSSAVSALVLSELSCSFWDVRAKAYSNAGCVAVDLQVGTCHRHSISVLRVSVSDHHHR